VRAALVPGALALLPEYAGLGDPLADLRAACLDAVAWLGSAGDAVAVLGDAQGVRVARALLSAAGVSRLASLAPQPPGAGAALLVVGNGSACRSERAPGHLDERAFAFDAALRAALVSGDASWSDAGLGTDLLASLDGIRELLPRLPAGCEAVVDYEDDPYGVQYWVMRWSCES
jgi:hypothetical protein